MNRLNMQSMRWVAIVAAGLSVACHSVHPERRADASASRQQALGRLISDLQRDSTHDLKGVMVVRAGRPVVEMYFNGDGPDTLHDMRSAGKSITSMLAGIALDRHLIANVDETLGHLVPRLNGTPAGGTTLRACLTMRTGLDADDVDSLSVGNERRLDESSDWLAFAGTVPRTRPQDERYLYASLNAFLAGAAVEQAAHMPLSAFADQALFRPLGITRYSWRRGPRGEGVGQGNLKLRLRDMVKLGELFLHDGTYNGTRVVSSAWVRASLAPIVPTGGTIDRYADAYGYLWYLKRYDVGGDSVTVHFASGNGGNKIYIVPQYDLVVAVSSSAYGSSYGQRRSETILRQVLASMQHGATANH